MKELLHLPRDAIRKIRRAGRQYFSPVLGTRDGNLKLPLAVVLDSVSRVAGRPNKAFSSVVSLSFCARCYLIYRSV